MAAVGSAGSALLERDEAARADTRASRMLVLMIPLMLWMPIGEDGTAAVARAWASSRRRGRSWGTRGVALVSGEPAWSSELSVV